MPRRSRELLLEFDLGLEVRAVARDSGNGEAAVVLEEEAIASCFSSDPSTWTSPTARRVRRI